ncbi:MAG: metal-dependent transcriptional regulator [Chloroflexi bacterium]|nr:metal-dependent transcriptional regulator [Chloroflexota bacterium]
MGAQTDKRDRDGVEGRTPVRHRSPSMEDYLEAIGTLEDEHGVVRVTQLSDALNVSKPSVTAAVGRLAQEGLVLHEKYGSVELTPRGKAVADDVWKRHETLWIFLTEILGVSEETAEGDACKLEHHLSPDATERLACFVEFVLEGEKGRPQWLEDFAAALTRTGLATNRSPDGRGGTMTPARGRD